MYMYNVLFSLLFESRVKKGGIYIKFTDNQNYPNTPRAHFAKVYRQTLLSLWNKSDMQRGGTIN